MTYLRTRLIAARLRYCPDRREFSAEVLIAEQETLLIDEAPLQLPSPSAHSRAIRAYEQVSDPPPAHALRIIA